MINRCIKEGLQTVESCPGLHEGCYFITAQDRQCSVLHACDDGCIHWCESIKISRYRFRRTFGREHGTTTKIAPSSESNIQSKLNDSCTFIHARLWCQYSLLFLSALLHSSNCKHRAGHHGERDGPKSHQGRQKAGGVEPDNKKSRGILQRNWSRDGWHPKRGNTEWQQTTARAMGTWLKTPWIFVRRYVGLTIQL